MVVDRDVEALAIVGSSTESRVTGRVGGEEEAGDIKGGWPQVSGGSTAQYKTVVYRSRPQFVYSRCESRGGKKDLLEVCGAVGVQPDK